MSNNPITNFIKSLMEKNDEMDDELADRVAEMSISSVKLVDQKNTRLRYSGYYKFEPRVRGFDKFYFAHSTFKSNVAGINSSAFAADFYNDLAEQKLERLKAAYTTDA